MKEFRKIKDWPEWLKLWHKNEFGETAISLLHIGPDVPCRQSRGIYDNAVEIAGLYEKIRFYIEIAGMDKYPLEFPLRNIGRTAYEIMVHDLLKKLIKEMEYFKGRTSPISKVEIPIWREIIEFFANKESSVLEKEPYKSEVNRFVVHLQLSLGGHPPFPFFFPSETRKGLSESKDGVARALVNVRAFEHILDERIYEAIPPLEEKIVHWCWDYSPGDVEMEQRFPGGKKQWQMELRDLNSKALQFALGRVLPREIVQTLMALIVHRG